MWEPWDKSADGDKCILFNVDRDQLDIAMSNVEYTRSSVMESMKLNVPEPLYSEAIDYMKGMSGWILQNNQ